MKKLMNKKNKTEVLCPYCQALLYCDDSDYKPLFEKLAAIEHERWADWQEYLHSKLLGMGEYLQMSMDDYEHWERQINTPYDKLSEREKESDREQVMRYWDLLPLSNTGAKKAITGDNNNNE